MGTNGRIKMKQKWMNAGPVVIAGAWILLPSLSVAQDFGGFASSSFTPAPLTISYNSFASPVSNFSSMSATNSYNLANTNLANIGAMQSAQMQATTNLNIASMNAQTSLGLNTPAYNSTMSGLLNNYSTTMANTSTQYAAANASSWNNYNSTQYSLERTYNNQMFQQTVSSELASHGIDLAGMAVEAQMAGAGVPYQMPSAGASAYAVNSGMALFGGFGNSFGGVGNALAGGGFYGGGNALAGGGFGGGLMGPGVSGYNVFGGFGEFGFSGADVSGFDMGGPGPSAYQGPESFTPTFGSAYSAANPFAPNAGGFGGFSNYFASNNGSYSLPELGNYGGQGGAGIDCSGASCEVSLPELSVEHLNDSCNPVCMPGSDPVSAQSKNWAQSLASNLEPALPGIQQMVNDFMRDPWAASGSNAMRLLDFVGGGLPMGAELEAAAYSGTQGAKNLASWVKGVLGETNPAAAATLADVAPAGAGKTSAIDNIINSLTDIFKSPEEKINDVAAKLSDVNFPMSETWGRTCSGGVNCQSAAVASAQRLAGSEGSMALLDNTLLTMQKMEDDAVQAGRMAGWNVDNPNRILAENGLKLDSATTGWINSVADLQATIARDAQPGRQAIIYQLYQNADNTLGAHVNNVLNNSGTIVYADSQVNKYTGTAQEMFGGNPNQAFKIYWLRDPVAPVPSSSNSYQALVNDYNWSMPN